MTFKILVPVDLAEESSYQQPLAVAFEQAQKLGGEVTVLTVVPDIMAGLDWRYAIRGEKGGAGDLDMKAIVRDAEQRLEQIVAAAVPPGITIDTIARHGVIYEVILELAAELQVDQIIMAAHRPTLGRFLLGEITARVVRHAKCSVNVVRNG